MVGTPGSSASSWRRSAGDSRAAMRRWLDDNRQDKHGGHRYTPDEFGLDPDALRERIARYDRLYYVEGTPEVSDAEYDQLFRELKELEAARGGHLRGL